MTTKTSMPSLMLGHCYMKCSSWCSQVIDFGMGSLTGSSPFSLKTPDLWKINHIWLAVPITMTLAVVQHMHTLYSLLSMKLFHTMLMILLNPLKCRTLIWTLLCRYRTRKYFHPLMEYCKIPLNISVQFKPQITVYSQQVWMSRWQVLQKQVLYSLLLNTTLYYTKKQLAHLRNLLYCQTLWHSTVIYMRCTSSLLDKTHFTVSSEYMELWSSIYATSKKGRLFYAAKAFCTNKNQTIKEL